MGTMAPLEERDRRIETLRMAMATEGFDAFLVAGKGHAWTGRGYLRYLTDFHLWGHDGLLLLPGAGACMMSLTSPRVAERVAARGWIDDVRGDAQLVRTIADAVAAGGLSRARIGIAGYEWIVAAGRLEALRALLPYVTFEPVDHIFDTIRQIKSQLEVVQSRELWDVMRTSMASFEHVLAPGISRRAAAAEAIRAAFSRGVRDMLVFVGEDLRDIDPPTEDLLRCDGMVRIHIEICGESGHWCERTMTYAFREPTDVEYALQEAEIRAFGVVRAAALPGVTLAELSSVYGRTLEDHGFFATGPSAHLDFHGQGLDANEYPLFSSADPEGTDPDAELAVGQIFSYHPARPVVPPDVWGPDVHDNILIGHDGAERLSGDWDLRMIGRRAQG
ncbi:Xaa-Pro peptidase family protein [soil metagenome]